MQHHPDLNALILQDEVRWIREVHIGVAVALEEGLIVPGVRNAHEKGITEIARETQDLEGRAKSGELAPNEVTGSTFTISMLGLIDVFTPILNPPEVAILGVGRVAEKPAIFQGQVVPRSMVTLNLTVDHRAVDGTPAATFLRRVQRLLGQPHTLFLGTEEQGGEEDAQH